MVVLSYLFYFSRLFASIVSLVLRTYLYRKYKAWVEIGSIQFSPLGGRLLFRDVKYVGQNETVRITMGHITWRYWLWRVRQEDDLRKEDNRLPCRTTVEVEGLEWFIYNRGPAFDLLLDRLGHREKAKRPGEDPLARDKETDSVRIVPPANEIHTTQSELRHWHFYVAMLNLILRPRRHRLVSRIAANRGSHITRRSRHGQSIYTISSGSWLQDSTGNLWRY